MSEPDQHRKPAVSLEIVDVHLDYLRDDMRKVLAAIATMATKEDLRALEHRMQSFVTRQEFDVLATQVKAGSIPSTLERWLLMVQRIGAAAAVFGGGALLVAKLLEKVA